VPTKPGLPLIDLFCYRPNCLNNGGKCTGVRHVPDPSIPSYQESRKGGAFVPLAIQRAITKHVRVEIAKRLGRPTDSGQRDDIIAGDIDFVREAHRREMRKSGVYV
jgi:hypothetical protein